MRMAGIAGVLPINYLLERGFGVYPEKSIPVVSAKKNAHDWFLFS